MHVAGRGPIERDDTVEVIATREFTDAEGRPATLLIHKPEQDGERADWRCAVTIVTPHREHTVSGMGVDSVQALVLALGVAKTLTSFLSEAEGPFRWFGQDNLGFFFDITVPEDWPNH